MIKALLLASFLSASCFGAPLINEFVADNESGLTDSDGAFSDWIEIHNPDPTPVDLAGWHLTDSASNLTKWTFPATVLPAGGYLVVFASGKNRAISGQELHANFSLSNSGEYLALVQPGATGIVSQFTPAYPPQEPGFSYGTTRLEQAKNLVATSVPSYLIPATAGALAADWTQVTMADATGWQAGTGTGAVGYETATAPPVGSAIATQGTASQTSTLGGFTANLANNTIYTDFTHTVSTDAAPAWLLTFTTDRAFSNLKIFNRSACCGSRLRDITVKIVNGSGATVYTSPLLNPENGGYEPNTGPGVLEVNFVNLTGGPVNGRVIRIERTPDPDLSGNAGQGNADERSVLSMSEVEVSAFGPAGTEYGYFTPLITTDVKAAMYPGRSSAFLRYAFTFGEPATVAALKLRMRYEDGFVAYLNGVKVAQRNVPVTLAWNSTATGGNRSDGAAVTFEEIDLTAFKNALVAGQNILAVHGLTATAGDPDFLLQPQLVADLRAVEPTTTYLRQPTPAAANVSSWILGFVADTVFSLKRGFYASAQSLTITTPTSGASIYYTTDGSVPSASNGTLYTAPIAITKTTVLRAAAFLEDWEPTNTDTQTYVFLSDVLAQQTNGAPPPGWPASPIVNFSNQSQVMNYGMDPNVRSLYGDTALIQALQQLPTISIATDQANLTHPTTGIYANALQHGRAWERPASIEWLDPAKPVGQQGDFQEDCGLRIRGGASRSPSIPKHSFRVYFRGDYGTGKLDYPVFGDLGTSEHDVIDLASSQNYSWARDTTAFDTMLRDPFARHTLLATGSPGCRNRYFHLYLNGIYWGLFYFDERVSGGYGEAYFGGQDDDYDVVKTGNHSQAFVTEATSGFFDTMPDGSAAAWRRLWNQHRALATAPGVTPTGNPDLAAYFAMLGRNADGSRNPALPVLVDVDSLIDYMLVIFYSGDGDAPLSSFLQDNRANNWFALKNRLDPEMGFKFFNHDAEHTFGAPSSRADRTGPFNGTNQTNFLYSNPQWIFQDLAFSPEFRLRVADRAHKHFFNSGVMTTGVAQARMDAMAAQINLAVKAHSLRWGDTVRTPAFNATDWQNAVNGARNWLIGRENTVVQQLRNYRLIATDPTGTAPLYPTTPAPTFDRPAGPVAGGQTLSITAAAGTIYYTLDGTDPRAPGGAATGTPYTTQIIFSQPITTVKARARNGSDWSALMEATYVADVVPPSSTNVAVSKIHYHPVEPSPAEIAAGFTDADEFEFLELHNIGPSSVNLSGVYFTEAITATVGAAVLPPGARYLLARNGDAFAMRYGFTSDAIYTGKLANSGDRISLKTPAGVTIRDFAYLTGAPWPTEPDGEGPCLVLKAPETNPNHGVGSNWRASEALLPGASDASSYAAWKNTYGVTGDFDDADGNGIPAFLEYATGAGAGDAGRALLPSVVRQGNFLTLTVHRRLTADDVTHTVEDCSDAKTYLPATTPVPVRTTANGIETLRYTFSIIPGGERYHRVRFRTAN